MPEIQSSPPQSLTYLQFLMNNEKLFLELQASKMSPQAKQITIGRTHDNTIQILNNTISKRHAKITYANDKHYLTDIDSVNGTLINGRKINKNAATILNNNDQIQFGKYEVLYCYRDLRSTKIGKGKSKGKINLKDYAFDEEGPQKMNDARSTVSNQMMPPKKQKRRVKQGKIRIPDITDYLKLDLSDQEMKRNIPEQEKSDIEVENKTFVRMPGNIKPRQGPVKLNSFQNEEYLSQDDLQKYKISQRQKNIYLQEQQAKKALEQKERAIKQNELKMQIQRAKYSEDLLQKQLILSEKVREEKQWIKNERDRLEQQFLQKQKEKREFQMKKIQEMEQKQKQLIEKIQNEKQEQLKQLEKKQMKFQEVSQMQYKTQYEKRKQELEMEAAALAQNYEKIYRETLQKVRTQIDNEEDTIKKMEEKQELLAKDNEEISIEIQRIKQQIEVGKEQFIKIHGRNKACILYASELQNKIDGLQLNKKHQDHGYFKPTKNVVGNLEKLQESILNSRRLLKIKKQQYEALLEDLKAIKGKIRSETISSSHLGDVNDYLDTITENMQTIEHLKEEYLEQIQAEKGVETLWELELEQFNQKFQKIRVSEAQVHKNARQIDQNVRDQIKKSTEQRLHLLKVLHFCSQQKKNAAKFLIEQMLGIQQDVHGFLNSNEEYHQKIVKIITQSEKSKRQNELLGEILFGQDENGHHFDNMKVVINNLIERIKDQRVGINIENCLRLCQEGMKMQIGIQDELQKKKKIQESLRKISQLGLASGQIKNQDKNPLIFFGDLLTKKQIEVERKKTSITSINDNNELLREQIKLLQQKKQKISDNLQKFKKEQLLEAKKYLS